MKTIMKTAEDLRTLDDQAPKTLLAPLWRQDRGTCGATPREHSLTCARSMPATPSAKSLI